MGNLDKADSCRAALPHPGQEPQKAESGGDLKKRRSLVGTFSRGCTDDLLQQVRLVCAKE